MRTIRDKFAKLYLTRKLRDNLKTYMSERLIKRPSRLIHRASSTV